MFWIALAHAVPLACPSADPSADFVVDRLNSSWPIVQAGDYDGDGLLDLAVHQGGQLVLLRGTATGFAVAGSVGASATHLLNADIDADGIMDVATFRNGSPYRFEGFHGTPAGFVPFATLSVDPAPYANANGPREVGDVTGDGHDDLALLLYGNDGDQHLIVFGSDPAVPSDPSVDRVVPYASWMKEVGDVDGDGLYELAQSTVGEAVMVFGNDVVVPLERSADGSIRTFDAVGDVDGDGATELAVLAFGGTSTGSWLELHAIRSGGTVERLWELEVSADSEPTGMVVLGDRDRDGLVEVLIGVEHEEYDYSGYQGWFVDGALQVWELSPTGATLVEEIVPTSPCGIGAPVGPGDVDGDGGTDIVAVMGRVATFNYDGWAAQVWKGDPPPGDTGDTGHTGDTSHTGAPTTTGSTGATGADTGPPGDSTPGDDTGPTGEPDAPASDDEGTGCGCQQARRSTLLGWLSRR